MPIADEIREQMQALGPARNRTIEVAQALPGQAGISLEDFDISGGAPIGLRINLSFAQSDADIEKRFFERFPEGAISRVNLTNLRGRGDRSIADRFVGTSTPIIFKETLDSKWRFFDPPGIQDLPELAADLAELPAASLPLLGAVVTAGRGGALMQGARTFAGTFVGELIQRDINNLLGTDLSAADQLTDAGIDAGLAGTMAIAFGLGARVFNAATGRGAMRPSEVEQADIDVVRRGTAAFRQDAQDIGELASFQQLPSDPVTRRLGQQAVSGSRLGTERVLAQPGRLAAATTGTARQGARTLQQTARELKILARNTYRATANNIRNRFRVATARQGDEALQNSIDDVIRGTRNQVRNLYGLADDAATAESPQFTLAGVKRDIRNVVRPVRGTATTQGQRPIFDEEVDDWVLQNFTGTETVPVSPQLQSEFSSIIKTINQLDDVQTDYNVLKTLRTRLFELRDRLPYDRNNASRLVDEAYFSLSRALNNPITDAPAYTQAITRASSAAAARFRVLENEQVRTILRRSSNTGELVERFGDPNKLDASLMSLIDEHAGNRAGPFKDAVMVRQIMDDTGNLQRLENIKRNDRELFNWLTRGSRETQTRWQAAATRMDDLNGGNIAAAQDAQTRGLQVIDSLLARPGTTAAEIDDILTQFGGRNSAGHRSLIAGAWERMVDRVIRFDDKGRINFDTRLAGELIKEYQENGVWRILRPTDRLKMEALQKFSSLRAQTIGDVGTTLEMAAAVSQLKHPGTFVSGAREVGVNKAFAMILMSPQANQILIGAGRRPTTGSALTRLALAVDALHETTQPGPQSVLPELD